MGFRAGLLMLFFGLAPAPARADVARYICSNAGIEVQCDKGQCEARTEYTPMSVTFIEGELSICAYSGCWTGRSVGRTDPTGLIAYGEDLKWSGSDEVATFRFALAMDEMTGMVLGGGFAQPLICNEMK